jgi:hypothetical protein
MMIQLSDDHRVSRAPLPAESSGQVKRESGHVGTERDLSRRRAEELSESTPRIGHEGIGLFTRGVPPMGIGVVVIEVILHGFHYSAGNLGSAGPVKIGHRHSPVSAL